MLLTLCNGCVHLVHSVGHVRCDIVQDLMAQHGALGKTYSWPVAMLQCPCHAIGPCDELVCSEGLHCLDCRDSPLLSC